MEIQVDDMTIGYQETISFSTLQDDSFHHTSTFQKMATPDGSSFVIIYQWSDSKSRTFNDREEAFYIDNVNDNNKEKAVEIFTKVYDGLQAAFEENSDMDYNMTELVNSAVNVNNKAK